MLSFTFLSWGIFYRFGNTSQRLEPQLVISQTIEQEMSEQRSRCPLSNSLRIPPWFNPPFSRLSTLVAYYDQKQGALPSSVCVIYPLNWEATKASLHQKICGRLYVSILCSWSCIHHKNELIFEDSIYIHVICEVNLIQCYTNFCKSNKSLNDSAIQVQFVALIHSSLSSYVEISHNLLNGKSILFLIKVKMLMNIH